MRLISVGQHSLHSEGLTAVLVPLTKMKYSVFFFLVCVAMAFAAPQSPLLFNRFYGAGYVAPGYVAGAPGTLVAGPTVVNNPLGWGGQVIAPGIVAPYF